MRVWSLPHLNVESSYDFSPIRRSPGSPGGGFSGLILTSGVYILYNSFIHSNQESPTNLTVEGKISF